MSNFPTPISTYTDPNWYNKIREFNAGGFQGPPDITPAPTISPISDKRIGTVGDVEEFLYSTPANLPFLPPEYVNALNSAKNREDTIFNTARAAYQREKISLNKAAEKMPQEYSYTTNVDQLKDRMVLILYSPNSDKNPGFNKQNRDQALSFGIIGAASNLLTKTGASGVAGDIAELADNAISSAAGFLGAGEILDGVKKVGSSALRSLTSDQAQEASGKFEYLNTNFYNDTSGSKQKTIYLPMPFGQLTDSHSHSINSVSMNPLFPILGGLASIADSLTGGGASRVGGSAERAYSMPAGFGQYAMNAMQLSARKAINPAQEMLYQSPVPRQWQFTFKYSPSSKEEADKFLNIVDMLKQHSYPTIDAEAILFNFPGTVDFHFVVNKQQSKILPYSKFPCFIKSVQVDYITETPYYSHFYDGNPTVLQLTIEIVESKLLTRESLDQDLSIGGAALSLAQGKSYVGSTAQESYESNMTQAEKDGRFLY